MFAVSCETANIKNNKAPTTPSKKDRLDTIQQNQRNTTPFDERHNGTTQKQGKTPLCFGYSIIPLPYPLENRKAYGFFPEAPHFHSQIAIPQTPPTQSRRTKRAASKKTKPCKAAQQPNTNQVEDKPESTKTAPYKEPQGPFSLASFAPKVLGPRKNKKVLGTIPRTFS